MMTLDECREHVGHRVSYRPGGQLAEDGVITGAGALAFVLYDGDEDPKATYPADLVLLEGNPVNEHAATDDRGLPPEVTDERIYADLKAYQDGGLIEYVLPSEPLGEVWHVGWNGQILKFTAKEGIVGFLTGIQVTALFRRAARAGLTAEPKTGQAHGNLVEEIAAYSRALASEARSRYILEGDPRKVKGRLMRHVLVTDVNGRQSVAVEVPDAVALDVLDALRAAYQQGREDNARAYGGQVP